MSIQPLYEPVDYEALAESFNQALLHTLRKHSIADSFLDFWVPDADPVLGIANMADSARIAGWPAITIRFSRKSVPEDRLAQLEKIVSAFAEVVLEREGECLYLHATAMRNDSAAALSAAQKRDRATSASGHADKVSSPLSANVPTQQWDSTVLPEFADVHPHFRQGLRAALERLSREGEAGAADEGLVRVEGHQGGVTLAFDIDPSTHVVRAAHHTGATQPSELAALDLFCRAAENLPFQEVADHVGLKVINSLVDEDEAPPVKGILLPINVGTAFMLAPELARQAYEAYRAPRNLGNKTNFYYVPPSVAWQSLSSAERREKVEIGLRGFLQSEALHGDDITLLRIEKNKYGYEIRLAVGFSDRIKIEDKPFLMRRLEQRLRRDLEPEIELIADRAKDTSPLRRLS